MNILTNWGTVFNQSLFDLWLSFVQFVPNLIVAIVLFVLGWVLAHFIAKAFEQVLGALKVDKLLESVGVDSFLRKAGMNLNAGYFIGQVVKWFVVVVFLFSSLSLVGLDSIADFLKGDVLAFLSKVIVASLVLVIASVVSEGISKTVAASARSMNLSSANLLGTVAKYAVWVFAFIVALDGLGMGDYMNMLFGGIIGMFAVAGALAFGLGGKDAAGRFIEKLQNEVSNRG